MGDKTGIQWTDSTWNPTVGCSIVSPGCTNCYAMKQAARIERMGGAGGARYAGLTQPSKAGPVWTGEVRLSEHALDLPLRWRRPRRIFVNSMSDLFHESLPDEAIDRVFAVMAGATRHTFQVLTKRADRMLAYLSRFKPSPADDGFVTRDGKRSNDTERNEFVSCPARWPLRNVWLGVSVEDQARADERIPHLLATPAAVRFLSCEPLLGPVDLKPWLWAESVATCRYETRHDLAMPGIDWVIAGGESGPGARPMSIQWARSLRDQCAAADVSFFFKQWGEWAPAGGGPAERPGRFAFGDWEHDPARMIQCDGYPREFTRFGARSTLERVGKRAAGHLLDGVEHHAFPQRVDSATAAGASSDVLRSIWASAERSRQ